MASLNDSSRKTVPAQLGFLAIYNPSLGSSDETVEDQIVYYTCPEYQNQERSRRKQDGGGQDAKNVVREQVNQQLRRIGFAQGMVEFGRSFSDGQSVDTIETEKSRIILHELESGWWILASINLSIIPKITKIPPTKGKAADEVETVEYSSREVKPAILLLGDLLRAHSTFLLHHASSMAALFVRTKRSKFIDLLGRYWDTFLSTWNVLMHGNPATSLYGGIKIAACGELGVGVGEEDRGSGEREVLEGFVTRIDGLVDVLLLKFGDPAGPEDDKPADGRGTVSDSWMGCGNDPGTEDGAIFLGTGALSQKSIRDISHWIEDVYKWGPDAYGVVDNPTSNRRQGKRKAKPGGKRVMSPNSKDISREVYGISPSPHARELTPGTGREAEHSRKGTPDVITSPNTAHHRIVKPQSPADNQERDEPPKQSGVPSQTNSSREGSRVRKTPIKQPGASAVSTDNETKTSSKLMQYFRLGYGTHWTLGGESSAPKAEEHSDDRTKSTDSNNGNAIDHSDGQGSSVSLDRAALESGSSSFPTLERLSGYFLIGLLGNLDSMVDEEYLDGDDTPTLDDSNERLLLRTLTVELEREEDARAEAEISIDLSRTESEQGTSKHPGSERTTTSQISYESQDRNKTKKLRVVVYVSRPFIFVFLFELRAESLALGRLYRDLHQQLRPLMKPLLQSTRYRASRPEAGANTSSPIYDLIWDPKALTINSSVPNIPDPFWSSPQPIWSRIEALSTHMQILNTYIAITKDRDSAEKEHTCKTSRGWWVVWTRIPDPNPSKSSLASSPPKISTFIAEDSEKVSTECNESLNPPMTSQDAGTFTSSFVSGPAHPYLTARPASNLIPMDKEIFLIRQASDYTPAKSSARFASGSYTRADSSWMGGPGRLAQGIGVDTKRYIDGLLNLKR